jgi:hypothetical protein
MATELAKATLPPHSAKRRLPKPPVPPGYFWAIMAFFVLEYMRPSGLVQLKLQMLIIFALPILWLRNPKKPWHPILTAQLIFLVNCAIAIPFAWNWYSAYFVTRQMFGNFSIALALSWILADRDSLARGMWMWALIMCYVALFSLGHGGRGPGGMLGDENDLALACNTALPLALFGFEQLKGSKRIGAGLVGVLMVGAVVVSNSRGGFVGLACVGLYFYYFSKHKLRNIFLVLVAVLAFVSLAPAEYLDEIYSIYEEAAGEKRGTAEGRAFMWWSAYFMWLDNPINGVGGGNFNWLVGQYQPDWFEGADYNERNWSGQATHSLYFQTLAEQGLIGIGVLIFVTWTHLSLIRRVRTLAAARRRIPPRLNADIEMYGGALAGALIGFLTSGAFLSVTYYPYFWYFSGLAVAYHTAMTSELTRLGNPRPQPRPAQPGRGPKRVGPAAPAAPAPSLQPRRSEPREPADEPSLPDDSASLAKGTLRPPSD